MSVHSEIAFGKSGNETSLLFRLFGVPQASRRHALTLTGSSVARNDRRSCISRCSEDSQTAENSKALRFSRCSFSEMTERALRNLAWGKLIASEASGTLRAMRRLPVTMPQSRTFLAASDAQRNDATGSILRFWAENGI
jgi:hypothetical protein